MYRNAKFYSHFLYPDKNSALDEKFNELIFLLKAKDAPIILLYLYNKFDAGIIDENTFIEMTNALISLVFRASACRVSILVAQFAGNVLNRLDKKPNLDIDAFWHVITFGKGKYAFPKDEEFQRALMNNELNLALDSSECKYLLYSLERGHSADLPNYEDAAVEYVMPKKINPRWKKYLDDKHDSQYALWINALGNMALIEKNSKTGNIEFANKKIEYAQSKFYYTNELKVQSNWTSNQIQARTKKLAKLALTIWPLPEQYNLPLLMGTIFYLDSDLDFKYFKKKNPATVSIFDKEQPISHWIDLLREIVKTFYELDRDIFKKSTQLDNVPRRGNFFASTPDKFSTPFKIDENYYMASNFDTEECLKIAKVLVENFDFLGNTNFKAEIWFTLKD